MKSARTASVSLFLAKKIDSQSFSGFYFPTSNAASDRKTLICAMLPLLVSYFLSPVIPQKVSKLLAEHHERHAMADYDALRHAVAECDDIPRRYAAHMSTISSRCAVTLRCRMSQHITAWHNMTWHIATLTTMFCGGHFLKRESPSKPPSSIGLGEPWKNPH